eukprot:scaffold3621_cov114-Cylindrotheca_fusiformis.AAC.3
MKVRWKLPIRRGVDGRLPRFVKDRPIDLHFGSHIRIRLGVVAVVFHAICISNKGIEQSTHITSFRLLLLSFIRRRRVDQ